MKLTDLAPRWIERTGRQLGVIFKCPLHPDVDGDTVGVYFANPIGGGETVATNGGWQRTGETFETLSITPSIQSGFCIGWHVGKIQEPGWHGYVTNGEVTTC